MNAFYRFLTTARWMDGALLFLRVFSGILIMRHGIQKIQNFDSLQQTFADPIGLGPSFSLFLIIGAEVGCALFIVLGLLTRLAAIPLIIGMFVAAMTSMGGEFSMLEMPLLYLGIFVFLLISGPGKISLDELFFGKRS